MTILVHEVLLSCKIFWGDFDYAVVKSTSLSSLFLTRFDGVEQINFLEKSDANEILMYAHKQKRKKRKKIEEQTIN